MDLNRLRVFHAVANSGSFTRASEELFLTQPGISKHVKQLEESLGIRLFDRLGKTVILTQAGEVLFESTKKVFETISETRARIDDLKTMNGGQLKIGASFTAGIYIVPGYVGRFNRMYPKVDVSLDISLSGRIAEKIVSNELDIGFIGAPCEDSRVVAKKFLEDRLVLIIAKGHSWRGQRFVGLDELSDRPFVVSKKGSGTRAFVEKRMEKEGVSIKKKIEFGNTEAVKKAVSAGIGVSILSEYAVEDAKASGEIETVPLTDPEFKRLFYYAWRKDKYLTKATREFIKLL